MSGSPTTRRPARRASILTCASSRALLLLGGAAAACGTGWSLTHRDETFAADLALAARPTVAPAAADSAAAGAGVRDRARAAVDVVVPASLLGASGRLRAHILQPGEAVPEGLAPALSAAAAGPGIHRAGLTADSAPFVVIRPRPFSDKVGARIGSYLVGYWRGERRGGWREEAPAGFIEVTRETQDLQLSAHFRLRDFLSHDQPDVWPKYLVLTEAVLDKAELVLAELTRRHGVGRRAKVLSGFRTPHHNRSLGDESGRALDSRHQYGDAVDLIVDDDGDGRMDDIDGDGVLGPRDLDAIAEAVDRVERAHPQLVGGLGLYETRGTARLFVHLDVRGKRARWRRGPAGPAWVTRWARGARPKPAAPAPAVGGRRTCNAPAEFQALCAGLR